LSAFGSARLTLSLIVFSLEANEGDTATIELRAAGGDWQPAARPFPGDFAQDAACRPGGQDAEGVVPACVAWRRYALDVPASLLARDFEARVRLHTFTNAGDAVGLDDVELTATW